MRRRHFLRKAAGALASNHRAIAVAGAWPSTPPVASDDGVPAQTISIVYNSKCSAETAAAQELAGFLQRMTGANPRVLVEPAQTMEGFPLVERKPVPEHVVPAVAAILKKF